jgi:hypothetical protein
MLALVRARTITVARAQATGVLNKRGHQYGGPRFEAASQFMRGDWRDADGRLGFGRRLSGMASSVIMLSRLPRAQISLTGSPAGEAIRSYLAERRRGIRTHRLAQGVLFVPDSIEEYLRGRRRQAVRTNIRRARSIGIHTHQLTEVSQRRVHADLVDPDLTDPWKREQLLTRPEAECWIAVDVNEKPVGLAVFTVDDEVALLWSLVSTEYPARWLLHAEIVEFLTVRRVRCLLVGAAMAPCLPPGIQYLQHLLGYRVAHLSVRRARCAAFADPPHSVAEDLP